MKLIKNTFLKCIFGAESKENIKVEGAAYINDDYFVGQIGFIIPIKENVKVVERIQVDNQLNYKNNFEVIYQF